MENNDVQFFYRPHKYWGALLCIEFTSCITLQIIREIILYKNIIRVLTTVGFNYPLIWLWLILDIFGVILISKCYIFSYTGMEVRYLCFIRNQKKWSEFDVVKLKKTRSEGEVIYFESRKTNPVLLVSIPCTKKNCQGIAAVVPGSIEEKISAKKI